MVTTDTKITVRPDTNLAYGNREEISALAKRIKMMLPGGDKLAENEALALAQVATVTKLNPFIGEVWYIPGKGPMIGIKGARRMENESTKENNGYSWMQFDLISPEECGAPDAARVFRAYRCTINDVTATRQYLSLFHDALEMLRAAETKDPYMAAKEICGPRPTWEGYGFSLTGEPSRMNGDALARKRAEADALKKRISIPFGADIADTETNEAVVIEATPQPEKHTTSENLAALGYGVDPKQPTNKDIPSVADWDAYLSLCQRAEKFDISYRMIESINDVKADELANLRANLLAEVQEAEKSAKKQNKSA